MLYKSNEDLPLEIRSKLSEAYQDLYRAAFNSAIHWYGEASKAHQVALSDALSCKTASENCLKKIISANLMRMVS
jgi:cation transport regulator